MTQPLLHDLLISAARRRPDEIALVVDREHYAYAEVDRLSDRLAHALIDGGVTRGDRVVVFLENGLSAAIAFWAVLKADAVVCPINPRMRAAKLDVCLRDCGAAAIVVDMSLLGMPLLDMPIIDDRAGLARTLGSLRLLVATGTAADDNRHPNRIELDAVLRDDRASDPLPRRAIDQDLAAILYTSGSTGRPKGVMLSHRNMLAATQSINAYLHNRENDILVCALPMSFDYGLYQMILAFAVGARLVLERPNVLPQQLLARMRSEKVSAFPAIPTLLAMMERLPAHHLEPLRTVRYVSSTGAHLAPGRIAFIERIFPDALIYSMFGLTECKRCTYLPPQHLHDKPGSVGIAIPNTEIWIADAHGRRLPAGQVGELVVRGATVMRGYWNDPVETAYRLRPGETADETSGETVLHTGDLCRMDEDGFLYFLARNDDLIKSQGYRIAPKEIEDVLLRLGGVLEAAVIGEPDELLGQTIKAFVVLADGTAFSEAQIRAHCARELEPPLIPSSIEIHSVLPRNLTGKIDRTGLGTDRCTSN
jgi:amino acid adenylation domain-containing protein